MKLEEADSIFGMIVGVFDVHPERAGRMAPVWVPALEELDAAHVMPIIDAWMRGHGPERMPNLIDFVRDARAVEERKRPRPTPSGKKQGIVVPDWVLAWQRLRGEGRKDVLFPEQEEGCGQLGLTWPLKGCEVIGEEEYTKLLEWAASVEQEPVPVYLDDEPSCSVCEDTGQVDIGRQSYRFLNRMIESAGEMAPCPGCDRGKAIEFPLDSVGRWGESGFWRGRQHRLVRPGTVELVP